MSKKTLNNNQSFKVVKASVDARVPICLVGEPGTSKTAFIKSLSKSMDYDLVTVILSRAEAPDVSGYPTKGSYSVNGEEPKPVTEYAPQIWQREIESRKKVILFFDEFSNTLPSTRASVLSIVQDRQFPDGTFFPDETVIILAMNPIDSAADGNKLDPATTNRMLFLSWKPSRQEWLDGMLCAWDAYELSDNEKKWRQLIVRFLSDNGKYLHLRKDGVDFHEGVAAYGIDSSDSSDMTVLEYAWSSRRSWDNLAKVLGRFEENDTSTEDVIMAGLVGYESATSFRDWLRKNQTLDIDAIISNPKKFKKWETISVDDFNMILRQMVDGLKTLEDVENATTTLEIAADKELMSYVVPHLKSLASKIGVVFRNNSDKDFEEIYKNFSKVAKRYSSHTQNKKAPTKS